MHRRSGLSLGQYFLRRKNCAGFSWYFNKTKMSRLVQARRLEGIDKNVWVEFVKLAATYPSVNLGQGFPDFPPPDFVKEAFMKAVGGGNIMLHQYTRAFGHPALVTILARFFGKLLGQELDPLTNVLVTVGAYEALFCCFQALVDEGDEKAAEAGKLMSSGDWQLDPAELASRFTERTKAIVLNSPNNPLGKVFTREEMELIADLCVKHDVLCFSDEVYEWMVYDGKEHIRIASLPGMWDRTITIGSAGKTFSATGWKVGWTLGPDRLLKHLRTVHQNSVYHCPTAAQEALAQAFQREFDSYGKPDSYFVQLAQELQQKRDWLVRSLVAGGLKPIVPEGTYFLMADFSEFKSEVPDVPDSDEPYDSRFIKWMIINKGLVAIPVSAFYSSPHKRNFDHLIRFCFAKETEKKVDWRKWKQEKKEEKKKWKEIKLLRKLEKKRMQEVMEKQKEEEEKAKEDKGRHYTVSVALPGSILNNAQSPELRTYLAGQIARACAIFCVDEIVVFDEQGEDSRTVEGQFDGIGKKGQACVQLARILQYLECPQYLRKSFFPKHQDLQFAGLLNPLDSPHHVRIDEESEYREGVVLARPTKPGKGSFVNCGMRKEVQIDKQLESGLRVTVQLDKQQNPDSKTQKGTVVSSNHPRTVSGLYWGYNVRLASCLSAVFAECPFKEGYDLSIGTSERGTCVDQATLPSFSHILIVFGGLQGLEAGVDGDPNLESTDPSVLFDLYLNTCPSQGSRTIRTEEAVLISLSALRPCIDEAVRKAHGS